MAGSTWTNETGVQSIFNTQQLYFLVYSSSSATQLSVCNQWWSAFLDNFLSILCTTTIIITIKHYLTPRSKLTPPLRWVTITGEYHWHQHHHHQQCHRHRRSYFFGVINLSYKSFYKNREIEAVALVDCPTQLTLTCFVHFEIWCLCLSAICQCFIAAGIIVSVCLFVWRNTNNLSLLLVFRICEFGGFGCTANPSQVETRTHEWSSNLLRAVENSCKLIFGNKCPPAPPLGNPWWRWWSWQPLVILVILVPSSTSPWQPLVKVVIKITPSLCNHS